MKTQIRRILVAIGDLRHAPKNELRKAATLARKSGASIELFHAITEPDPGRSYTKTPTAKAVAQRRAGTATKRQHSLQRMARDPSLRGLEVTCIASWDFPPHEAIVRRAHSSKADLVIAATRRHRLGARLLLTNTDWELMRQCPVPVLLVKSRRPYKNPVVVAAVDPFHSHSRPADLDRKLLDTGADIAELLRGRVHAFHSYMPLMSVEPMPGAPPVMLPPDAELAHEEIITREVEDLAGKAGVPPQRCHLCMGSVADELDAVTRRTRAHIVVMGAVSRSALARMFIGNAAERVLDRLSCDVLVVKPRGFKTKVSVRPVVAATAPSPRARRSSALAGPRGSHSADSQVLASHYN